MIEHSHDDEVEIPEWNLLRDHWENKIKVIGPKIWGHGHYRSTVEILSGDPPKAALLLAANDWQEVPFGGVVEHKYKAPDDEGNEHRYAVVKVYTD